MSSNGGASEQPRGRWRAATRALAVVSERILMNFVFEHNQHAMAKDEAAPVGWTRGGLAPFLLILYGLNFQKKNRF